MSPLTPEKWLTQKINAQKAHVCHQEQRDDRNQTAVCVLQIVLWSTPWTCNKFPGWWGPKIASVNWNWVSEGPTENQRLESRRPGHLRNAEPLVPRKKRRSKNITKCEKGKNPYVNSYKTIKDVLNTRDNLGNQKWCFIYTYNLWLSLFFLFFIMCGTLCTSAWGRQRKCG